MHGEVSCWTHFVLTLQEPPNLSEMMKPVQNVCSPASLGLKDEDDDDGEGEDGDGDVEKADPANVNPERLKAFNVRTVSSLCCFTHLLSWVIHWNS